MLNIEKYKDEILNEYRQLMSKNTPYYMDGTRMNKAILKGVIWQTLEKRKALRKK